MKFKKNRTDEERIKEMTEELEQDSEKEKPKGQFTHGMGKNSFLNDVEGDDSKEGETLDEQESEEDLGIEPKRKPGKLFDQKPNTIHIMIQVGKNGKSK